MKTKLLIQIVFTILGIFLKTTQAQDSFVGNIYTPNEHSQPTPSCIVYNEINDLYYVYTGQKIILVNKSSGNIAGSITVGQTGYYDGSHLSIEKNNKIALDQGRNYLYCANDDNQLLVIDCSNNHQIIHQLNPDPQIPLIYSFVFYNSTLEVLYWAQNSPILAYGPKLTAYNPDNMQILGVYQGGVDYAIDDFTFCYNDNYLVISTGKTNHPKSGHILLLNPLTLAPYDQFLFAFPKIPNKLLYIDELNRLYCLISDGWESNLQAFTINVEINSFLSLPNYSISNFPVLESVSACYLSNSQLAYFTGKSSSNIYYLVIFNYTVPNPGSSNLVVMQLPLVCQVTADESEDRVYCAGELLTKINGTQIEESIGINGVANHLIIAGNQVVVANCESGTIQSYSTTPELIHHVQLGDMVLKGVLNPLQQKVYWVGESTDNPYSFLTIQNLADHSLETINIGPGIKDIDWNSYFDKLVVSNFNWSGSKLTIIDGSTNNPQIVPSGQVEVIRSGNSSYVYLGGVNSLDYIDLQDNSIYQVINNPLTVPYRTKEMVVLNNGNCIALVEETSNYGFCKLVKIDHNTHQVTMVQSYGVYQLSKHPLVYSPERNHLYILCKDLGVTVIDAETFQVVTNIIPPGDTYNCHYSSRNNMVIIEGLNQENQRTLWFFSGAAYQLIHTITVEYNESIISSIYNPTNDMISLHLFKYQWDYNYDNEIRLQSFSCSNFQKVSDIYLQQNNAKNIFGYNPKETMVLNANGDSLFVPNLGLGNISIVQCSKDLITLQPGTWNWISFPRLDRQGNDPVPSQPLLEGIVEFPSYLQLLHVDPEDQNAIFKQYSGEQWLGILDEVQSTLGYKLETDNAGVSYLPMSGTILAPETTLPLFADNANWTGYFLTRTQSPFDAIDSEFLDKFTSMAGQHWFCYNQASPAPTPKNSGSQWRCACNQGRIEIKYTDMIVIRPFENISNFQWQYSGQPLMDDPKEATLFYSFEEKADYEAIFIELDTLNTPSEIGAFAGDSCIGATTVLPADSLVLICAYTEGFEGQEISFEMLYPGKSSRPRHEDYLVMNTQTGIREKRRIVAGEKQPYHVVSFGQEPSQRTFSGSLHLQCIPNPANRHVTVSYFLANEAVVGLQLTNALGMAVMSWKPGWQSAGNYSFGFSTESLPAGYYQLSISDGTIYNTEKLLIIH